MNWTVSFIRLLSLQGLHLLLIVRFEETQLLLQFIPLPDEIILPQWGSSRFWDRQPADGNPTWVKPRLCHRWYWRGELSDWTSSMH